MKLPSFLQKISKRKPQPVSRTKFLKSFGLDHLPRAQKAAVMREMMRTR